MRADRVRAHRLWVGALVGIIGLGSGCKKQEPPPATAPGTSTPAVAATPPDAGTRDAGVATAPDKPLRFSDVKLAHDGKSVKLAYALANLGPQRVRGVMCLRLHDAQGAFIGNLQITPLNVKGGDSDVYEDTSTLEARFWKQARSVQLFATREYCVGNLSEVLSPTLHLDTTGQPLGADAPKPQPQMHSSDGNSPFKISDVRLVQNAEDIVSITYTVKNDGGRRESGSACLRAFQSEDCKCSLEESLLENFSLPPGGSETITETVSLDDEKHWDDISFLRIFASPDGCSDHPAEGASHMLQFDKPEEISGTHYDGDGDGTVTPPEGQIDADEDTTGPE